MYFKRLRWALAVTGIFLPTLLAQAPPSKDTVFTSATNLVLVPTVVSKSGAHLSGLKKEDFVLKQDGKPQAIAVFEEVTTNAERVSRSNGEHGTFTNVDPAKGGYQRLSIIVLDFVNTPLPDQSNARTALIKFLSEIAESREPMCLLALTSSGLTVLQDFTDDPKLLATALSKAKSTTPLIYEPVADPHHPTGGSLAAVLTAMIRGEMLSETKMASVETKAAASVTVQALQQIAKAFRGFPGRKALIWASSGFPFSLSPGNPSMCEPPCPAHGRAEMQSAYDNLWKIMNDAQIAIYSVDLRLPTTGTMMTAGGVRPSDVGDQQFDSDALAQEARQDTNSTLRLFAENTGGKAFLGGANLVESLRQAIQDDSSYYMLGYYVNANAVKPGWHDVSVGVHAKGSKVRSRSKFYLSRDVSTTTAQEDVQLALRSPLDYTGIPISITWTGSEPGKAAGKTRTKFDLVLPSSFASIDRSDGNHMVVDIAAVARSKTGEVTADLAQRIDVHLDSKGEEQIEHNGMTYQNGLQLPPGDYNVRFVVRDALGNRMGSVAAPVKVAQ